MFKKSWKHDELADDLAAYLSKQTDRIIWTNMQLGPSGSPRPDVYTIPKSYSSFRPIAYECKVSVADFRSDITKGKWQSYLKYASGVIFAVPKGLISKEDLPKGCGLIVRGDTSWRMVKGPTLAVIKNDLPADFWIKLVIDGVNRSKRAEMKQDMDFRHVHNEIRKKYGQDLAILLSERDHAESKLESRIAYLGSKFDELDIFRRVEHCKNELEDLKSIREELCDFLGVSHNSTSWLIKQELKDKIQMLNADHAVQQMKKAVIQVLNSLERATNNIKPLVEIND